jgi:hypothetical protein
MKEAIAQMMRIHYGVFMENPRFWYDKDLQEADKLICVSASDLRRANSCVLLPVSTVL